MVAEDDAFADFDYFMMCVTKGYHVLTEDVTDTGGHKFEEGFEVVEGFYFERYQPGKAGKWDPVKRLYVASAGKPGNPTRYLMYAHLVRKVFELPSVRSREKRLMQTLYQVSNDLNEDLIGACTL